MAVFHAGTRARTVTLEIDRAGRCSFQKKSTGDGSETYPPYR